MMDNNGAEKRDPLNRVDLFYLFKKRKRKTKKSISNKTFQAINVLNPAYKSLIKPCTAGVSGSINGKAAGETP